MMKTNMAKGILFISLLLSGVELVGAAQAEVVYYPVTLAMIDPATGAEQQHTIYVPLDTATGTVRGVGGGVVRQPAASTDGRLPSNPWQVTAASSATTTTRTGVATNAVEAPLQQGVASETGREIVVVPQAVAATAANYAATPSASRAGAAVPLRDRTLPQYSGTNTTWNTAMGQEMIAPEVNKDNMIKMAQHLRSLGYQVPDSLDTAIANAPEKTRVALISATNYVRGGGKTDSSPVMQAIGKITRDLETNYGISFENIMDTSMKILDSK